MDDEEPAERAQADGGGRRPEARPRRRRFPGRHGPPAVPAAVPRGLQADRPGHRRGAVSSSSTGAISEALASIRRPPGRRLSATWPARSRSSSRADRAYRDSQPDITHHHVRLITRPRLWTAIHAAWVQSWRIRAHGRRGGGRAARREPVRGAPLRPPRPPAGPHAGPAPARSFRGGRSACGSSGSLPLLGPFVRRLWGRGDLRRHYAALADRSPAIFGRAFRGHVAESLIGWHRTGRVSERAGPGHRRKTVALHPQPAAGLPARRRSTAS
ncbi:MAG: hypothetical protein MZW92_67165 [Comamonadaceae bacterium]|nr:hypothetical protein [Comamonadaceae bacterium]